VAAAIVPKPYPPQPTALLVLVTAVVVTVWELVGGEPGLATSIKRCGGTCCRSWNFKKLIVHAIFDRQIGLFNRSIRPPSSREGQRLGCQSGRKSFVHPSSILARVLAIPLNSAACSCARNRRDIRESTIAPLLALAEQFPKLNEHLLSDTRPDRLSRYVAPGCGARLLLKRAIGWAREL
jgi:hypothetical protein